MGKLLEKVVAEAKKLPEQEQEAFAAWALAELQSEKRWDDLFARSQDLLARMAADAKRDHHAGRTQPLDPKKL